MQYKYIHVSCFDEVIEDIEKRIRAHYNDTNPTWRSATRIARELGFKPITQRETRGICKVLRQNTTKTRVLDGIILFLV